MSSIVGAVVACLVVGGAGAAIVVPRVVSPSGHEMQVVFPSADGLVSGSDVLEAGADVGTISSVEPTQTDSALVVLSIDDAHWPLHRGVTVDIRPKSLLGEKYVDLHDGPSSAPAFTATVLHAPAGADPVELDQFINSLDTPTRTAVRVLLDDLGAGVAARGPDLNTAIATGKANLANLAQFGTTLNNRDADLDRILVGLDGVLGKLTTSEQLTQMAQLIDNGQVTLQAIENAQQSFSRQFTDANLALADLNTVVDGAVPSLRSTLEVAPSLIANLTQESSLLANLGAVATSPNNLSPHGECTSSTTSNQPITSVIGAPQCSPLWELVKGLVQGPSASAGAEEKTAAGAVNPIFRVCIVGLPPQLEPPPTGGCDNSSASQSASGFMSGDGALFASFLGS